MRMLVRAQGDEVHIELNGVAGRQQRVLQALSACQNELQESEVQEDQGSVASAAATSNPDEVRVRASANMMRIRLCGHNGRRYDANTVYRRLRHLLVEHRDAAEVAVVAVAAAVAVA